MMVREDLAAQIQTLAGRKHRSLQDVTDTLLTYALSNLEPDAASPRR